MRSVFWLTLLGTNAFLTSGSPAQAQSLFGLLPPPPQSIVVTPLFPFRNHLPQTPSGAVLYDFFPRNTWDVQVMGGAYFSPVLIGPATPRYHFAPLSARAGIITDMGLDYGLLRGSFEPMLEFTVAPVWGGLGTTFVGSALLFRYNFTQPHLRTVPYFQVGAGITFNDGFRDPNQRALGQAFEFLLQAKLGLRWFVADRVSLDMEFGLMHISNAGLAPRNEGINALGGSIGISYCLGGPRQSIHW